MTPRILMVAGTLLASLATAHAQQPVSGKDFVAAAASSGRFEIGSSKMASEGLVQPGCEILRPTNDRRSYQGRERPEGCSRRRKDRRAEGA